MKLDEGGKVALVTGAKRSDNHILKSNMNGDEVFDCLPIEATDAECHWSGPPAGRAGRSAILKVHVRASGIAGALSFFGFSAIIASVVTSRPATEAAS
jgi:hypothetical protein